MTSTAWQPLSDQILVRPTIAADRSAGGIVLAEQHRERPQTGIVLAVGPAVGKRIQAGNEPGAVVYEPHLSVGDLVAFGKYAGVTFNLQGEDVLLMRDLEAMARKPAGAFEIVEHEVPRGIATVTVCHEAGERCEHCPAEPRSSFLDEERARLLSERAPQAADGVAPTPPPGTCGAASPGGVLFCALAPGHDGNHCDTGVTPEGYYWEPEGPAVAPPQGVRPEDFRIP